MILEKKVFVISWYSSAIKITFTCSSHSHPLLLVLQPWSTRGVILFFHPLPSVSPQRKHEWADSGLSAAHLGLTFHSHSESVYTRGSKQHIIIVLSLSLDNGHMVSTKGKKLNLSAVQCSKRVVLNKLALEGEFPWIRVHQNAARVCPGLTPLEMCEMGQAGWIDALGRAQTVSLSSIINFPSNNFRLVICIYSKMSFGSQKAKVTD